MARQVFAAIDRPSEVASTNNRKVALYSTLLSVLIGSRDNHKDQRPKPTRQTGGGRFRLSLWDWETNWIMIFKRQDPEK